MFHTKQDVDRHVNEIFKNLKGDSERNFKCYQIAKHYYKVGDYKSTIKYVNRYISTTSGSAPAHRLLGDAYLGINAKMKALDAYKASLELDGNQRDLVLKVCELLSDPEVPVVASRATYWLERAENLFPKDPIVFKLKEHLLKCGSDGKEDSGQLENLLLSEINARPTDVTVRIRLLKFFIGNKRFKVAYQYALELEMRNLFKNDLRWYDCLHDLVQAYEKAEPDLGFDFFIRKIFILDRRANLSLEEFQTEVKTLTECSSALFAFDQALHSLSKIVVPNSESAFFNELMKHLRAQLSFYLATLALKRAKKECGIWPKAERTASPLFLQATRTTMDLDEAWYSMLYDKNKKDRDIQLWNKDATFRISQAGHVLNSLAHDKNHQFLEKVSQFCGGKWRGRVYQDVFYNREHQQAIGTSHFMSDPSFADVPLQLLTDSQLSHFDKLSQSTYPNSLHHLVWLGLASFNSSGQLKSDFRCTIVPDLQFSVENLSNTGPETLNQLDIDAFLYAAVLCAKAAAPTYVSNDRPTRLPVSISEDLCSPAQADWWDAVYKTYMKQTSGNISDMRLKLRKGIETIRVIGHHGLHVKLIVLLAKLFQERAANNKNSEELPGLEARTNLYWTAAIPLLEKIEKNQQLRSVPNRLFDYRGKDLTNSEIKAFIEDGRLFLACRLMKQGRHEEAIEAFQVLKSPYATFYQAMIYKKLASEEVNHRPESITSENRSQHCILLTRARDALFLTLDRLRSPSVDPAHPLNSQLHVHLEEIETQLARIDPDSNLNRNGDAESDETDTAPGPLSPDVVGDNLDHSFNVYNTNNFMAMANQSTPRGLRNTFEQRHHTSRIEARPSPERLDAQLRHLIQANSNGLQSVLEELKDMKITVQSELKDIKVVVQDALSEFKKWHEKTEAVTSKGVTEDIKSEDLFEFPDEEDYDISQLTQQYNAYQSYPNYRQLSGLQGTSTVTYGAPVPSVPPAVPSMMQPPGAPLIPQTFFSNSRAVPPTDPSLLLYQTLNYYNQGGLPFSEGQNLPDFRTTGIQKGAPFAKTPHAAPVDLSSTTPPATISVKPQPPNVVITSSDTLPAYTNTGTPTMSVTIPPQHLKGAIPQSGNIKPNQPQVHAFQIPMPPQAQTVKESPSERNPSGMFPVATSSILNYMPSPIFSSVKTTPPQEVNVSGAVNRSELNAKPDFKNIPLPGEKEVRANAKDETKLFESRAKLFVFFKSELKENDCKINIGEIKVLHHEELGKARIVMRSDQDFKICVNHWVTSDMELKPFRDNDRSWIWSAHDYSNGQKTFQNFCVRFKTIDELRDFEYAFNKAKEIAKEMESKSNEAATSIINLCPSCGKTSDSMNGKCGACQKDEADKLIAKPKLGGFTFSQSPVLKPPALKPTEEPPKEKPVEPVKPSPFAKFSFAPATTSSGFTFKAPTIDAKTPVPFATQTATATETKAATQEKLMFGSNVTVGDFSTLAAKSAVADAFKASSEFKGFAGQGSLVFGGSSAQKANGSAPSVAGIATSSSNDGRESTTSTKASATPSSKPNDEEEGQSDATEFVPTAEFAPVIPLPDLVEVKTGEEGETILYEGRAKILRYDSDSKQWKEKGIGMMKLLLNETTGKVRLLMRREQVFKVCCNHFLDEKMEFKTMTTSDKALTWIAQDYSEGDLKPELLAIRFGKCESMQEFKKVIEDTQKKMKNGRMIGYSPESKETAKEEQKPLSELFKAKPGTWECGVCYVRNKAEDTKCCSCETPKPGSEPEPAADKTADANAAKPKGIYLDPSLATKFNFGIPPSDASATSTSVGTKSEAASVFGDAATKKTEEQRPNFFFGIPQPPKTDECKPDSTTKPESKTERPNFFFGGAASLGKENENCKAEGETKKTEASPFVFGNLASNGKTENKQPAFVFGNSSFGTDKTASPFSFGTKPDGKANDFKIGSPGKFEFSFSGIKQQPVKSPGKAKSPGGGVTSGDESDYEPEEDDGEHITFKPLIPLPDKVPVRTGEEDETVLYVHRAKLFRFTDGEWKERGIGDIKILKHNVTSKVRLLMRREQVLKICLNHYLTKEMEFLPKDNKSWLWSAADFSDGEVRPDRFAIRFKTPEIASEFKAALDSAQKDLVPSPVKPEVSGKEPTEAMKSFSFSIPPAQTPKSTGSASGVSRNLFASNEDVAIVYETQVTPEQREAALRLQLPPNFYSYLNAPKCPGCVGCSDDDEEGAKDSCSHAAAPEPESKTLTEKSSCWGTLSFDKGEGDRAKDTGFRFGGFNTFQTQEGSTFFPKSAGEPPSTDINVAKNQVQDEDQEEGYEDDDEDDDEDVDEEDEDEEDDDDGDFDIHDAEETLVLEKHNFVLHKFDEATGKYDTLGKDPTLQLFENDSYFRIYVEEIETGEVLSDTYFDPAQETMFKMSSQECMWVSQDQAADPPSMRNILIKFNSEKDLDDFLHYFGENDPPEEILNSFRTSPA